MFLGIYEKRCLFKAFFEKYEKIYNACNFKKAFSVHIGERPLQNKQERGEKVEDSKIIKLYKERSEEAIWNTKAKYGQYCRYILKNFLSSEQEIEEVENDVYLKLWLTIPSTEVQSLKGYIGLVARSLAIKYCEKKQAVKRGGNMYIVLDELAECIPDNTGGGDIVEGVALRDALGRFLRSAPEKTRKIFIRRYWYAASVEDIAEEYGMSKNSVLVLLHRTRKKLKKFLEKEGYSV